MQILLKSGLLRKVALTKHGDLDVHFRFCAGPDAGYTKADVELLAQLWDIDQLLDLNIDEASDVKEPDQITGEIS